MATVFIKEWLLKAHSTEYTLVSESAMETLFEDLCKNLPVENLCKDQRMQKQVMDAALVRAADDGWQFCAMAPWSTPKESIEFRYAQWLLKQMSNQVVAKTQLCFTQQAQDRILSFLVKHPTVPEPGILCQTNEWSSRAHYGTHFAKTPDGKIIAVWTDAPHNVWTWLNGCRCCRAHEPEDWLTGKCEQCVEGWVLSCVSKSWWSTLRRLVATWGQELRLRMLLHQASCESF